MRDHTTVCHPELVSGSIYLNNYYITNNLTIFFADIANIIRIFSVSDCMKISRNTIH